MNCSHLFSFANNAEILTGATPTVSQGVANKVRAHVEQCGACQRDMQDMGVEDMQDMRGYDKVAKVQYALVSALYRKECPDCDTLSAYAANMLPKNEQLPVQLHLRVCPLCASEVEDARALFVDTEGLL